MVHEPMLELICNVFGVGDKDDSCPYLSSLGTLCQTLTVTIPVPGNSWSFNLHNSSEFDCNGKNPMCSFGWLTKDVTIIKFFFDPLSDGANKHRFFLFSFCLVDVTAGGSSSLPTKNLDRLLECLIVVISIVTAAAVVAVIRLVQEEFTLEIARFDNCSASNRFAKVDYLMFGIPIKQI
ncbi:hypothetical protein GQX74_015259 [Glossina fuscipes]|nr:hypothetical protein GQX74_015259 [Glossina fuscipes]